MIYLLFLLDAAIEPTGVAGWGGLVLLLGAVFVLAVGFVACLVFLLIRLKRRKLKQAAAEAPSP